MVKDNKGEQPQNKNNSNEAQVNDDGYYYNDI